MTTIDSSTLHNNIVTSSQENLQEENTGANSMPTQAPKGEQQNFIVQSSPDEFDADARADDTFVFKWAIYNRKYFEKLQKITDREKEKGVIRWYNIFIPEEVVYPLNSVL